MLTGLKNVKELTEPRDSVPNPGEPRSSILLIGVEVQRSHKRDVNKGI